MRLRPRRPCMLGVGKAVAKAAAARGLRWVHSLEGPFEELFAAHVAAPERVAIVCGLMLHLTYGELAVRARAVGRAVEWEKGGERGYDGSNSLAEYRGCGGWRSGGTRVQAEP